MKLYRATALMFGETAAVYAFLRISRALSAILSRLFLIVGVEFFDDFSQIESLSTAASGMQTIEDVFSLLGWVVSMSETKRLDFGKSFVSLGVMVNFYQSKKRAVVVENKPGRVEAIIKEFNKVLERRRLDFKGALSLKGKISFAEGQLFYRIAAPLCRLLSKWASAGTELKIDRELEACMVHTMAALRTAGPRVIRSGGDKPPAVIFVDGACEPEGTTIGAVLFDGDCQPEVFGAVISTEVVESWVSKLGQKQVIGQAEIYPTLIARPSWSKRLFARRVVFFGDNDSARMACIKSYSPVLASLRIIMQ